MRGSTAASAPPNFITEVFYLTVRLGNLGLGKAIRTFEEKEKDMGRLRKRADEYEADRAVWSATPQAAQYEAFIKKARAEVDKSRSELLAAEGQLLDPAFLQRVIGFVSFVMTWLVRVADPKGTHPQPTVSLPLPQEVPQRFSMLPEHIFEDVCDILLFVARYVDAAGMLRWL